MNMSNNIDKMLLLGPVLIQEKKTIAYKMHWPGASIKIKKHPAIKCTLDSNSIKITQVSKMQKWTSYLQNLQKNTKIQCVHRVGAL